MNIFQENQNCFNPFVMPNVGQEKSPKLFDPQEAFMLGNLFKNLYVSYCGFSNYCLQPQSRKQQMLLEVQINDFVAHEINLYLDTHPQSERMIKLYNEYVKKAKESRKAYEKEFGPLNVQDSSDKTPFEWVQGPWPWEYQC